MAAPGRIDEWRRSLTIFTVGLLGFETLTGLSIYLLPFSVTNQVMVLLHTVAGLAFLVPFAVYQLRHWRIYRSMPMTHVKLTGYFALAATTVACVSGVVLTVQALFGSRISYAWDLVHIVSTFALIAAVSPHVVIVLLRDFRARASASIQPLLAAERRFLYGNSGVLAMLAVLVGVVVVAYSPVKLDNRLPDDYNYLYGDDRPFAPSLATTSTGDAFDARTLGDSESCGRCHVEIYEEWEVSAHRYAALDPAFRAVQTVMGEQNGAESTRYCGGCHDPISLFSGTKNLFQAELTNPMGLDEGISCISCHAIKETDVKGNADYVMTQPERYMFELHEGKAAQVVSDFLIRAYPRKHVESLQHKLFKSPTFCAACHKQFIDEEINNVGWVQLQNQYDNWRKSRWNHPGDPLKTVECRECHMPLMDSFDPASGDDLDYNRTTSDGKHRSHRFLGANQYVPALLELPGAEEHVRLTEQWLRGEYEIPEIAEKWRAGPAIPIELFVPESVGPGEEIRVDVQITNNKAGHDFPTGPLDIIQSWIELTVTDQDGVVVFETGKRDDGGFVEPGSFMFKAEPVDQYGNLIDRHNLWEMVGVRYRRALYPGFSDRARFVFACPSFIAPLPEERLGPVEPFDVPVPADASGMLTVQARLMYRKIDQFLLNTLFGPDSGLTARVTEVSSDVKHIAIRVPGSPSTQGRHHVVSTASP